MKNLILKWCGLTPSFIGEVVRITVRDEIMARDLEQMALTFGKIEDKVIRSLNNGYDLDGMSSKLDDIDYLTQDLESRGNRWDEISDNLEGIDLENMIAETEQKLDKVQQLDDRLTELLEGYKLDVRLVQEDF